MSAPPKVQAASPRSDRPQALILPDIRELAAGASAATWAPLRTEVAALAFFDLSGSTQLKLTKGHKHGTGATIGFTRLAATIVAAVGGCVVKELGDGVFCRFADPLLACQAALNLKQACWLQGIESAAGLTMGSIDVYTNISDNEDMLGAAVDRCARLQALAYPGQIVIDLPFYEIVRSHLTSYDEVIVSDPFLTDVKGIGELGVRELSLREHGLINQIVSPFQMHSAGRLSIAEKIRFMNRARSEIIEIGTGLTTFARYFTGQKPKEFRDHIRDLLARGVNVRCYAADPEHDTTRLHLRDLGDENYLQDAARAREMIITERQRFLREGLAGELQYSTYRLVPPFNCICVDGEDPVHGRMLLSQYLPGVTRAEAPVMQVSAVTDPALFGKYLASAQTVIQTAANRPA